jgi:hypothetical protein
MKWCAAETVLHAEFVTIPNLRCIAIARPKNARERADGAAPRPGKVGKK